MSDNKALVKSFLEALGAGDAERLKALITKDITAVATGSSVLSMTRNYDDIVGTAQMLKAATKNGIEFRFLNLTAEADRVAVEVEGYSTLVNGVPYNNQYHMLFFIRDGKICKMKEYFDTKLADAALGPLMAAAPK
ncbi:MAG: nuclear transport factor 2 family protein [Steroidobacteraceae bacterium]